MGGKEKKIGEDGGRKEMRKWGGDRGKGDT
jgi:hypothetical protein